VAITNKNSETDREIRQALGLQMGVDTLPSPIPVVETNPKVLRVINIIRRNTATNATSATIFAVPTGKEFYLVAMQLNVIKDVTATSTVSSIEGTPENGAQVRLLTKDGLTLTAQDSTESICLPLPGIKMKAGTNITINNATATGNVTATGVIFGYSVDASKE